MEIRTYEVRKNPSIIFLFGLLSAKMYYDIDKDSYYLYVFSSNRNRIVRKIKIEKHDIQRLLAFALYDRYGEEIPKTLWINRRIRAQIQELTERENKHYTHSPAAAVAARPSQKDEFSLNNLERVKIENDPF